MSCSITTQTRSFRRSSAPDKHFPPSTATALRAAQPHASPGGTCIAAVALLCCAPVCVAGLSALLSGRWLMDDSYYHNVVLHVLQLLRQLGERFRPIVTVYSDGLAGNSGRINAGGFDGGVPRRATVQRFCSRFGEVVAEERQWVASKGHLMPRTAR